MREMLPIIGFPLSKHVSNLEMVVLVESKTLILFSFQWSEISFQYDKI